MVVGTGEEDNGLSQIWTCYILNIYTLQKYKIINLLYRVHLMLSIVYYNMYYVYIKIITVVFVEKKVTSHLFRFLDPQSKSLYAICMVKDLY